MYTFEKLNRGLTLAMIGAAAFTMAGAAIAADEPAKTAPAPKADAAPKTEAAPAEAPATAAQPAPTGEVAPAGAPASSGDASPKAVIEAKADWPCVWRKVVTLDAATIWDGPQIDPNDNSWRKDDAIRKLSQYLVSRRIKEEEADAAVKKFADGVKAEERDKKLTDLFTAVLTRTNEDRKLVVTGIERFNKRQIERALEIEKEGIDLPAGNDLAAADPAPAGAVDKLSDKEEKYKWEVRSFQEKQQNIPVACEIPQLMDERAGALARSIRALMKS